MLVRLKNHNWTPTLQCLPLGLVGALLSWACVRLLYYHEDLLMMNGKLSSLFSYGRIPTALLTLSVISGLCALLTLSGAFAGLFTRRAGVLNLLRKGYASVYAYFIFYAWTVISLTTRFVESVSSRGGDAPDAVDVFFYRWDYIWPVAAFTFVMALLHLRAWRRMVINAYTGSEDTDPARGDLIVEDIRTHGRNPEYRKSNWTSGWSHLLVIIIIPWLLNLFGCIDPYRVPFGGGEPAVQRMQIVKPKKKKKKKEYILSLDTAILFNIPDLDDSKIYEEIEMTTRKTYMADASAAHGKLGSKTANQPGFWDGFLDGQMRFIRLEYRGAGWDDGMDDKSRADMNFLLKFREVSGGMKTALQGESHAIRLLKKYPRGQEPPFVYMTGVGGIDEGGEKDRKILRKYLRGGGMLFADAGSGHWDGAFRSFIRRLFPGKQLAIIADDDPIFQLPFTFPNGAPPLWHHGGRRALGIKEGGRWIVFYHPGDMNDAWKVGHSGLDPHLADSSYQLGINVVYYSTMRYMEATRKYRKGKK
jgi:hypothetical protein